MSGYDALILVSRLLGISAIIHSIEFLKMNSAIVRIWHWQDIVLELTGKNRALELCLRTLLGSSNLRALNILRLILGVMLILTPHVSVVFGLLVIHILTLLRFRGTFNGGSDYMVLLLLALTGLGLLSQQYTILLWFMVIQVCLSYFKAGYHKVLNIQWRNGEALRCFLLSSYYEEKAWITRAAASPRLLKFLCWGILFFELSFPIVILSGGLAIMAMVLGALFHMGNAYFFGLNRFFWAWLAAYPALYYCCCYQQ